LLTESLFDSFAISDCFEPVVRNCNAHVERLLIPAFSQEPSNNGHGADFAPKLDLPTETHSLTCHKLEKGGLKRHMNTFQTTLLHRTSLFIVGLAVLTMLSGCSGGALTTREKGAGIGAVGGAVAGGLIGAAVGHPGAGAAIGGAFGLGAGALIGDQFQGQEIQQQQQDEQIRRNQAEIERQRLEMQRIKRQQEY
jgi:hypothetical protein